MSVTKRGKVWYLHIWPFRKLINLRTPADSRAEAKQIERAVLTAIRADDYRALNPRERETCIRLFRNQGWEIPKDLFREEAAVTEELTLWKAIMEIFINYPGVKESPARARYVQSLMHFVDKWGKKKPIKSIWVPQIRLYQTERLSEGASASTVNKEQVALSRMFRVLQELRLIDSNPCRLVKRLSEKSGERQVYLSYEDFNRILEYVPDWFRPIAQTAYYTGMRRGEIVGLKRDKIDLKTRMIYLGPQDTKEGQWKRVPIHRDLMPILEEILSGSVAGSTVNVFLKDGLPITDPSQFRRCWDGKPEKAGLDPRLRFHDLRHTWKTNARRSGVHPEIAEAIMGHATKTRSVSARYGLISDEELVSAIDLWSPHHGKTHIYVAEKTEKKPNRK